LEAKAGSVNREPKTLVVGEDKEAGGGVEGEKTTREIAEGKRGGITQQ
jgi:hypothetical protein